MARLDLEDVEGKKLKYANISEGEVGMKKEFANLERRTPKMLDTAGLAKRLNVLPHELNSGRVGRAGPGPVTATW